MSSVIRTLVSQRCTSRSALVWHRTDHGLISLATSVVPKHSPLESRHLPCSMAAALQHSIAQNHIQLGRKPLQLSTSHPRHSEGTFQGTACSIDKVTFPLCSLAGTTSQQTMKTRICCQTSCRFFVRETFTLLTSSNNTTTFMDVWPHHGYSWPSACPGQAATLWGLRDTLHLSATSSSCPTLQKAEKLQTLLPKSASASQPLP